jgi:hypothetical protein
MLKSLIIFLLLSTSLSAQKPWEHYAFSEVGGTGGLYSLGWEGFAKRTYALQVGLSAIPADGELIFTVPAVFKYVHGNKSHHPEIGLGLGTSLVNRNGLNGFVRGIGLVGWRYQAIDSRWCYRAYYSPLVSFLVDFQWQHWGGIGISYRLTS